MKLTDDYQNSSTEFQQKKKNSGLKSALLFLIKFIGTGIFLYWAFSLVEDKQALIENFHLALRSPIFLCAGISLAGIALFASALRLYILLRAVSITVSLSYIVRLTLIAALFTVASLGTAAGDAMKMISIMRRHPNKKVIITMTVMADHMVGLVSAALIFLYFGWVTGTITATEITAVRQVFMLTTVFQLAGIFCILILLVISSDKILEKLLAKLPRIATHKHVSSITASLNTFRANYRAISIALTASLFVSAPYFLCFYVSLRTIGENVTVSTILTVMPIVDLVSSLPITISGLGLRERTFDFLVSDLANIETSSSVSASLIGFLFHAFWGLVGGVYLVFKKS